MQVSHSEESNNYAIIGGGKVRDFSIKASAHAFKILTDSLYQDKPYAVARETICNATDIHTVCGVTRPIEITINDKQFIVKDFGSGIADDQITDIFLTLFGSTKELDDRQTGGFGLGCKAPFSVTDHFMVVSCHNGQKTTYALTSGSDETDGKPTATVMHQAKTEETGLTVIVPLDPGQEHKFFAAIKRTIRDGGIDALVNGEKLRGVRDYSGLQEAGFGLYPKSPDAQSALAVLYGNVLYPVVPHEGMNDVISKLQHLNHYGQWQLVLWAPPSSITPKPDRESIGYNDKTLKTLNKVGNRAWQLICQEQKRALREMFIDTLEKHKVRRHNFAAFMHGSHQLNSPYDVKTLEYHGPVEVVRTDPAVIVGAKAVARAIAHDTLLRARVDDDVLYKIAARYYRDQRKGLLWQDRWGRTVDLDDEMHRYSLRKIMRAVLPVIEPVNTSGYRFTRSVAAGDKKVLTYPAMVGNSSNAPVIRYRPNRMGKMQLRNFGASKSDQFNEPVRLTLAPTATIAIDSSQRGYFLVTTGWKPEQIAEVKRRAQRIGIHVAVLEKPDAPKIVKIKEKLPESIFFTPFKLDRDLEYRNKRSSYEHYYLYPSPTLSAPRAFVAPAATRRKITWKPKATPGGIGPIQPQTEMMATTLDQNSYTRFANRIDSENVAMPRTAAERDRLLALGVPRYADMLLAKARKTLRFHNRDEAFVAALTKFKDGSSYGYTTASRFGITLAVRNYRLACAVFMQDYKPSPRLEQSRKMWAELDRFFGVNAASPTSWLDEIEWDAFIRAKKEYLDMKAAYEPFLPEDERQFFRRLRRGKLKDDDLKHLDFLAHIITEPSQIRLVGKGYERFIKMIEDAGLEYIEAEAPIHIETGIMEEED